MFLLLLLVSHECIVTANHIRQGVKTQQHLRMQDMLFDLVEFSSNIDGGDSVFDSLVEVDETNGMTAMTAQRATDEVKEIHKSLKEGFAFKNSPVLEDLSRLETIPNDKVLSATELRNHRSAISALLEKAFSGQRYLVKSKDSDLSTGKILDSEKSIEKALNFQGVAASVLYGFVDGFLGGMVTDIREGWSEDECRGEYVHVRRNVSFQFKEVLRKAKHFWHTISRLHKHIWTSVGRKHMLAALKTLLQAVTKVLRSTWRFAMSCPITKTISVILGVMVAMTVLNIVFIKVGLIALPVIIKLVGVLLGLYFAVDYMKDTAIEIWQEVKKIKSHTCHVGCKKTLIEKSAALVGTITEVILLGGLGDLKKVKLKANKPDVKNLLKKYKIEFDSDLFDSMNTVQKTARNARKGFKTKLKTLSKKMGYDSFTGADDFRSAKPEDFDDTYI